MPRGGTGTCTTPAGQPVVAGTVISDTVFNALVSDIYTILSDSLSRSGSGSMSVPLQFFDGTIGAPGIAFSNEGASGLYRAGANDIRMSIAGVDRCKWTATGLQAAAADIALIDRAGTIGIGTTSGTTITLGRAGQVLTVASTLDAAAIDRAGTIEIGATSGTTVTLGRSGQSLSVQSEPSGPYTWRRVVATGDTSNSSTGATTNIAGLTFAATTGRKYLFRAKLFVYSAASTTGVGIALATASFPTTSTLFYTVRHSLTSTTMVEECYNIALEPISPIPGDTFSTTSTNPQCDIMEGYMVTTGNGTVQLNLQTEVNLSAVTVKAGSYLEWMEFT